MSVLGVTTDAAAVIHTVQQYSGVTERGVARSMVLGVTPDRYCTAAVLRCEREV